MVKGKKRKWTVFFLVKSVDDSIDELINMINEIRSLTLSSDISVVFCLHVLKDHLEAVVTGDQSLISPNAGPEYVTAFHVLVKQETQGKFRYRLEQICEDRLFDITDPQHVQGYFRDEVLQHYQAEKYMLVTWDHGSAFGIFTEFVSKEGIKKINITTKRSNLRTLTMEEMAQALEWAFGARKIDLLMMVNCYMQFMDAGYALRHQVKYLVAPEGYLAYDGYNYPSIFQVLGGQPGISAQELAKHVISSFPSKAYPNPEVGNAFKNITAVFATHLTPYDQLAHLLNELCEVLLMQMPGVRDSIRALVPGCYVESGKSLIDIFYFTQRIEAMGLLKSKPDLANRLLSLRDEIVLSGYVGKHICPGNNQCIPNGISAYFPEIQFPTIDPNSEEAQFYGSAFMKNNRWPDLLAACL